MGWREPFLVPIKLSALVLLALISSTVAMKLPITRENLQAYDTVKAAAEKKEEQIQGGLYQLLVQLGNDFERALPKEPSHMDRGGNMEEGDVPALVIGVYPIARDKTAFQEKRFIWSNLQQKIDAINYRPRNIITLEHIPRFIKMVEENFIGCTIIVDPLKTYIIIDWS